MAKETAIVLPAIIFVMALFVPLTKSDAAKASTHRNSELRDRVVSALSETVPFLIATAIYLLCRWHTLNAAITASTQHLSWHTVMLSWPATLWFYGKVMLWPVRSRAFADSNLADHFSANVFLTGLGLSVAFVILIWASVWAWRKALRDLSPREADGCR